MPFLKACNLPGNVRERKNIIERGVALCQGETLQAAHLLDDLRDLTIRDGRVIPLEEQERKSILWVLEEAHGTLTALMQGDWSGLAVVEVEGFRGVGCAE